MDLKKIEKSINLKLIQLKKADDSTFELSEQIKNVWSLFFAEIENEEIPFSIWVGFREQDSLIKIEQMSSFEQGIFFHEKYKTDSNCYLGYFKHDSNSNKMIESSQLNFFIDSWYGSMSGSFKPFLITKNSFYAKKKVA